MEKFIPRSTVCCEAVLLHYIVNVYFPFYVECWYNFLLGFRNNDNNKTGDIN